MDISINGIMVGHAVFALLVKGGTYCPQALGIGKYPPAAPALLRTECFATEEKTWAHQNCSPT